MSSFLKNSLSGSRVVPRGQTISEVWRSWWSLFAILRMRLTWKTFFFFIKRQFRIVSLKFSQWCSWGSCHFGTWRSQWPVCLIDPWSSVNLVISKTSITDCASTQIYNPEGQNPQFWIILKSLQLRIMFTSTRFKKFHRRTSSFFAHRTNSAGINETQTILSSLIYNIQPTNCTSNYSIIWLCCKENIWCMYSVLETWGGVVVNALRY